MTRLFAPAAALALAMPFAAGAEEIPAETVTRITEMLAGMQCEMDPADIEADGAGYELDDVFCADGQYDIELGADLNVTGKRKE